MRRFATKIIAVFFSLLIAMPAFAADWPQLQHDAAHTGRTADSVAPPYRIRWMWIGPTKTYKNKDSGIGGTDNLSLSPNGFTSGQAVGFTIASQAQAVIANGRVFIGTQEGQAYGINANDGATLWTGSIPGGTMQAAAVATTVFGDVVVFVCMNGMVYGLHADDGSPSWSFDSGFAISGAPATSGGKVFFGNHGGYVFGLDAGTGAQLWKTRLPAPVQGGAASDGTSVFIGADNMMAYALSVSGGSIRASHQLRGQSFRMTYPVLFNNLAFFTTARTREVGSEYVMESLMDDSGGLAQEESNIALWFQGNTNGGRWTDASPDQRHLYALNISDLSEPFTVLCGPSEGCGQPETPPVVDNQNRVLCWWKTRYPKVTANGAFGTKYAIDIAAINMTDGHRIPFEFGANNNKSPVFETDNLYALSIAGDYVWLRQRFRGTHAIRLTDNTYRDVEAEANFRDGGTIYPYCDVIYAADDASLPQPAHRTLDGHTAASISGNQVYLNEAYGIVALEHVP